MTNPIIRGFRSLTRFSGRDRRSQFWPYAGVAVALTFVAMGAAMVWVMSSFWAEAMQIAQAHPETVTVESGPGYYSRSVDVSDYGLMPDFTAFFTVMGVVWSPTSPCWPPPSVAASTTWESPPFGG